LAACRGGGALLSGGTPKPLMPPEMSGANRFLLNGKWELKSLL